MNEAKSQGIELTTENDQVGENLLPPGIIATLGELKPGAVITEEGVAFLFKRHVTSIKRAVLRGELPPPCRMFGGNVWTAGVVLTHIEARLAEAAKEAEALQRKIRELSP